MSPIILSPHLAAVCEVQASRSLSTKEPMNEKQALHSTVWFQFGKRGPRARAARTWQTWATCCRRLLAGSFPDQKGSAGHPTRAGQPRSEAAQEARSGREAPSGPFGARDGERDFSGHRARG